jgi:hypothetical protein
MNQGAISLTVMAPATPLVEERVDTSAVSKTAFP